jgi:hypothetical protein
MHEWKDASPREWENENLKWCVEKLIGQAYGHGVILSSEYRCIACQKVPTLGKKTDTIVFFVQL